MVAGVQLIRDVLILLRVHRDVGIQQKNRNPSCLHPPHLRIDISPRILDGHRNGFVFFVPLDLDGLRVEIIFRMALLLPAIDIQILTEIPLLIEQSDTDERNTKVACRFDMVAGKNSQAARIVRQTFCQSKLCGKICDRRYAPLAVLFLKPA